MSILEGLALDDIREKAERIRVDEEAVVRELRRRLDEEGDSSRTARSGRRSPSTTTSWVTSTDGEVAKKRQETAGTTYHCKLTDEDRKTGCMEVELAKGRYLRNGVLPLR